MVTADDSGDVAFVVGDEKSVAFLLVEEKPKGKGDDMVIRKFYLDQSTSTSILSFQINADKITN